MGIVENSKDIVVLYDRGLMDNRTYLSHEDYNNMLKKYNYNELAIIDQYDLVINLISLATINSEDYCLDGINYELPEEAARRDMNDKVNIVLNYIYDLLNNKKKMKEISK